ncbi:hypothetical protein P171DRAFT_152167 [Karstenula rhodostoma CBS 690.94]|uniref:Uncharacterized protein n=1 Tax=Karstenula rhodostoma CBS 690.94 TaxID=1392251 RepID=A0A9P4PXG3_9PLEO|nr:hypothetical protein P171DRAFT_152167 [Karstenula rhodostoma CBS 690.94]
MASTVSSSSHHRLPCIASSLISRYGQSSARPRRPLDENSSAWHDSKRGQRVHQSASADIHSSRCTYKARKLGNARSVIARGGWHTDVWHHGATTCVRAGVFGFPLRSLSLKREERRTDHPSLIGNCPPQLLPTGASTFCAPPLKLLLPFPFASICPLARLSLSVISRWLSMRALCRRRPTPRSPTWRLRSMPMAWLRC